MGFRFLEVRYGSFLYQERGGWGGGKGGMGNGETRARGAQFYLLCFINTDAGGINNLGYRESSSP